MARLLDGVSEKQRRTIIILTSLIIICLLLLLLALMLPSFGSRTPMSAQALQSVVPVLPNGEDNEVVDGASNLEDHRKAAGHQKNKVADIYQGAESLVSRDQQEETPARPETPAADATKVVSDPSVRGGFAGTGQSRESRPAPVSSRSSSASPSSASSTASLESEMAARAKQDELLLANGYDPEAYHRDGSLVKRQEETVVAFASMEDNTSRDTTARRPDPVRRRTGSISSLDDDFGGIEGLDSDDQYLSSAEEHPIKVMFTREEKLRTGQRVTLRLLEDIVVDGVVVPRNTHLMAVCSLSERLEMKVSSLEMNGRIYSLDMDAYDTDGAKGIYCAQSDANRNVKQGSQAATEMATTALSAAVGSYTARIAQAGATMIQSASGNASVSVSSGYQFFLVREKKQ